MTNEWHNGPLVIGAGLMRTGTNSQMKALEILLGGKCYHMEVIVLKNNLSHLKLWHQAATTGLSKELADTMLQGYRGCVDFPAALFYQELSEIYPNAKIVLSVREPKRWVESLRSTIFALSRALGIMWSPGLWLHGLTYFQPLHDAALQSKLGMRLDMTDDQLVEVFNRHTESVIQAIPEELVEISRQYRPGPLVIGAGLMRTGTTSQMKALETLLGGKCYHMRIIMSSRKDHLALWYRAATEGLTKDLADELLGDFRSCTDYPAAHFYQELAEIYPNAKFVLSVRDPKNWVRSVRETIQQVGQNIGYILPPVRWFLGLSYFLPNFDAILGSRLGISFDMTDDQLIGAFNRHNDLVVQTIPKDRLLVFRVSDGWEPLCRFLDVPVPDDPFPHVNDAADFQKIVKTTRIVGIVLNLAFCFAVGLGLWFGAKYCLNRFA